MLYSFLDRVSHVMKGSTDVVTTSAQWSQIRAKQGLLCGAEIDASNQGMQRRQASPSASAFLGHDIASMHCALILV